MSFDWRYWLIVAVFALWELYWGVAAMGTKRATRKEPLITRIPVVVGILLAIVLLLAPGWLGSFMDTSFTAHSDATYLPGLLLACAGMGFAFWARGTLGRNWSGRVTIKEDHELVTRGPYTLVRHPIYTGALLGFGGSALALGHLGGLFSIAIMLAIFLHKIRLEERVMGTHFGEHYAEYRRRTRALIPFLI
ncbi:MAG TPA: isoprenylcysteine carboxylmethyltransferase family protein [Gammaproteobacteria bacterium]|nr:isoprenylcysteine carboxylmethyltransferase family protein [Gammaproteobacteria bacterium]